MDSSLLWQLARLVLLSVQRRIRMWNSHFAGTTSWKAIPRRCSWTRISAWRISRWTCHTCLPCDRFSNGLRRQGTAVLHLPSTHHDILGVRCSRWLHSRDAFRLSASFDSSRFSDRFSRVLSHSGCTQCRRFYLFSGKCRSRKQWASLNRRFFLNRRQSQADNCLSRVQTGVSSTARFLPRQNHSHRPCS